MQPTIKTSSSGGGFDALKAKLAQIAKSEVYVGVPEDETERKKTTEVTNAGLLYIHTHGSPLQGIPARPVIEPALEADDNKALITKKLGETARAVLASKPSEAKTLLKQAGMEGSNAAKRWFTDSRNAWAADSAETIERKGSDRPLIDTAQLRRSITYLVDET
jgi:hypothetical protein